MKFQYSKILTFITGLIFMFTLYMGFKSSYSNVIDVSFFITASTISGGIFGTSIVWYLKKSQTENVYKIKIDLYERVSKVKYEYNEKMYELKNKYGCDDLDDTDSEELSSLEDEALSDVESTVNNDLADATSEIELQNYN